jgi:beta-aspartyl-peptidase (threonine type)
VGAVARDAAGHVAAATSTGGITGKEPGRVGDSPLAGAGTYADDALGAASATGEGEGIIRVALSTRTLLRVAAGVEPRAACEEQLARMLDATGARGGLIVVAADGRVGWARTTTSMPWAAVWSDGHAYGA